MGKASGMEPPICHWAKQAKQRDDMHWAVLGCAVETLPVAIVPSDDPVHAPTHTLPQVLLAHGLSPCVNLKGPDGRRRTLIKTWYNSNW